MNESNVAVIDSPNQPCRQGCIIRFLDQQEVRGALGGLFAIFGVAIFVNLYWDDPYLVYNLTVWKMIVLTAMYAGPIMVMYGCAVGLSERLYSISRMLSIMLYLLLPPSVFLFVFTVIFSGRYYKLDWIVALYLLVLGMPFAVIRAIETIIGKVLAPMIAVVSIESMFYLSAKFYIGFTGNFATSPNDSFYLLGASSILLFSITLSQRIGGGIKQNRMMQ